MCPGSDGRRHHWWLSPLCTEMRDPRGAPRPRAGLNLRASEPEGLRGTSSSLLPQWLLGGSPREEETGKEAALPTSPAAAASRRSVWGEETWPLSASVKHGLLGAVRAMKEIHNTERSRRHMAWERSRNPRHRSAPSRQHAFLARVYLRQNITRV